MDSRIIHYRTVSLGICEEKLYTCVLGIRLGHIYQFDTIQNYTSPSVNLFFWSI